MKLETRLFTLTTSSSSTVPPRATLPASAAPRSLLSKHTRNRPMVRASTATSAPGAGNSTNDHRRGSQRLPRSTVLGFQCVTPAGSSSRRASRCTSAKAKWRPKTHAGALAPQLITVKPTSSASSPVHIGQRHMGCCWSWLSRSNCGCCIEMSLHATKNKNDSGLSTGHTSLDLLRCGASATPESFGMALALRGAPYAAS